MNILIAVMSYNRGQYLLNCIDSIQKNLNFSYELVVYDDHSTDPETKEVLKSLPVEVRLTNLSGESKKHKGLYQNMNHALRDASDRNFEALFVIQDDMQVIRKIGDETVNLLDRIFSANLGLVSIVPLFFKKNHQKNYDSLIILDKDLRVFYSKTWDQLYMNGVADVGIFDVRKLSAVNWVFENNETENLLKGKSLRLRRAVLKSPFLAYLPWPKTFRHRITTLSDLLTVYTDKIFNAGFHPFKEMTELAADRLEKSVSIPFAEDYLELRNPGRLRKPWNYYESSFPVRKFVKKIIR